MRVPSLIVLIAATATFLSCAGSRSSSEGRILRFKSATLAAHRPGGSPWHVSESSSIIGGIAGFVIGQAVGYPGVGARLGARSGSEKEPRAPRPYVVVKVEGQVYSIAPGARTLAPAWDQPIAIDPRRHRPGARALLQVRDAVDDGVLGQRELPLEELLSLGARTLVDVGAVSSIDLAVEAMPPRQRTAMTLHVSSTHELDALRAGRDPRWAPVPVWNGDHITIEASGSVCPSRRDECFDADGAQAGRWESYNHHLFKASRHASLVGVLPTQAVTIGKAATVVAEQSGSLLLFVNDTDVDNNSGGFDVTVTIEPGPR